MNIDPKSLPTYYNNQFSCEKFSDWNWDQSLFMLVRSFSKTMQKKKKINFGFDLK